MKRSALLKSSGPYRAESHPRGYYVRVYPAWPEYDIQEDGSGGPGGLTRFGLASDIERFLNGRDLQEDEFDKAESPGLREARTRMKKEFK